MAGRRRPGRARPAVDLPDRQAQPAAAVPRGVRRPGPADQLPAARVEHPRAPGARAAQRPALQRPGRAFAGRLEAETGGDPSTGRRPGLPAGARPAADGPRSGALALEFLRDSRSRNSPWPCSTSMGSSMFPERLDSDLHARTPARRAPAASSSATPSAASAAWRLAVAAARGAGPGRHGRRPARAQAAASSGQGEVGHLPVHGRRARATWRPSTPSRC